MKTFLINPFVFSFCWVMINCSKFVCSKNLLDTILLLLDSIRAIIIFLVNWSTAVLNLLSCRINWIWAIDIICVNCSNCQPLYIRTVDTNIKTDINFARIAITRQIFCFKNTYGRWFLIFEQLTKKVTFARMVSSKWKIVSSRFFEQTNFEQMIMTQLVKVR